MKRFGQISIAIGSLLLLLALLMDTSVQTKYGRVNNIGLMSDRQTYLFLGVVLFTIGILLVIRYRQSGNSEREQLSTTRPCPFCAETVKAQAVICRFCGNKLENVAPAPSATSAQDAAELHHEWTSRQTEVKKSFGRRLEIIEKAFQSEGGSLRSIPAFIGKALGVIRRHQKTVAILVLLLSGVAISDVIYRALNSVEPMLAFYLGCQFVAMVVTGVLLYKYRSYEAPFTDAEKESNEGTKQSQFSFFGQGVDLLVLQAAMLLLVVLLGNSGSTGLGICVALLLIVVSTLAYRLGYRVFGAAMGVVSLLLVLRTIALNASSSSAAVEYAMERLAEALEQGYFSIYPYLIGLTVAAAIPHLQRLRVGELRFGRLPGDLSIEIKGRRVFLDFTSVAVFGILLVGVSRALEIAFALPALLARLVFS